MVINNGKKRNIRRQPLTHVAPVLVVDVELGQLFPCPQRAAVALEKGAEALQALGGGRGEAALAAGRGDEDVVDGRVKLVGAVAAAELLKTYERGQIESRRSLQNQQEYIRSRGRKPRSTQ